MLSGIGCDDLIVELIILDAVNSFKRKLITQLRKIHLNTEECVNVKVGRLRDGLPVSGLRECCRDWELGNL